MIGVNNKKAVSVFSHIRIKELENWLPFQQSPIVVVDKLHDLVGILDDNCVWKKRAEGKNELVETCTSLRFLTISSLSEIGENDPYNYDFFIMKEEDQYICYTSSEVREWKYQKKINSLLEINQSLHEQLEIALRKNKEFTQILNSTYDEIFVTDAEGNVLFVSESCKHFTGLPPEAFIHKNIHELVNKGIITNSVTLKTMATHTIHSVEQEYPSGKTVLATATPVFNDEGKLYRIVCNSRDISELVEMKRRLTESQSAQQDQSEPIVQRTIGGQKFLTQSKNMVSTLQLAERIAPTDSSIFIHGESGVGKGVLAKIVHEHSPRKGKPFVQVNCGAIPETLLESELFGYEAGAFTGANKRGKAGLVEMADEGTLFLDEIGEMPLGLQVKILQLVQDKTFKKVGGTTEKQVNIPLFPLQIKIYYK
ncbi:MAG TPA: sigma 54-interacting transcriptional regulator [Pseudobacillus sp.]